MSQESSRLFQDALGVIPGGVSSPVRSCKHVRRTPIYFEKATGALLTDVDGKNYTDFVMGFGPHLFGHCPSFVVEAVKNQAELGMTYGACHPKEIELARLILKGYPFLDQVRLVNSGTEAVMTSVRLARGKSGRQKVIQFEGCYHGHSDSFLAKAGSGLAHLSEASSAGVPSTTVQETIICRVDEPGRFDEVCARYANEIAAVIIEPVPANNGLWVPSREFLSKIVDKARSVGAAVIFDEVICGFRLGPSGASGWYDLQPDLVTLGKIIGGGLPLAAVAGRKEWMERLAPQGPVYQAGTYAGNPLVCAAAIEMLKKIFANPPYEELASRTAKFAQALQKVVARRFECSVRTIASMFWLSFQDLSNKFPEDLSDKAKDHYAQFFGLSLDAGLYFPPSPYEVGFLSTAHTDAILEQALNKLSETLK